MLKNIDKDTVLFGSIIIVIGALILIALYYFISIELHLSQQPVLSEIGIVKEKIFIPSKQTMHTSYNSSTKQNRIYTSTTPEEYETYILLNTNGEVICSDKKQHFVLFEERDSVIVELKRWNKHTKIINIMPYLKNKDF